MLIEVDNMTEEPAEQEELFQEALLKKLDGINNSLKNLHACLEEIVEKL